ncbi:hypothetical protein D3C76_1701140 [compost metagenome]
MTLLFVRPAMQGHGWNAGFVKYFCHIHRMIHPYAEPKPLHIVQIGYVFVQTLDDLVGTDFVMSVELLQFVQIVAFTRPLHLR